MCVHGLYVRLITCTSTTHTVTVCEPGVLFALHPTQVELAYRGSEEETRDLLGLYAKFRGNMHQAT